MSLQQCRGVYIMSYFHRNIPHRLISEFGTPAGCTMYNMQIFRYIITTAFKCAIESTRLV